MESFDYEQVKTKLSALGTVFDDFIKKLNDMNTKLNNNVSVGEEGAFQGVVAAALLESWNLCSDKFVTFKEEFDILLGLVLEVSDNNASLEDEVMAMYRGETPVPVNSITAAPPPVPVSQTSTVKMATPPANNAMIGTPGRVSGGGGGSTRYAVTK